MPPINAYRSRNDHFDRDAVHEAIAFLKKAETCAIHDRGEIFFTGHVERMGFDNPAVGRYPDDGSMSDGV